MKTKVPFMFVPVDSGVVTEDDADEIAGFTFSAHQWPLLSLMLGSTPAEAAKLCDDEEKELVMEAESINPLSEETCQKISKTLISRYGTSNPALIAIWSWAKSRGLDVAAENFDSFQSEETFSCSHVTSENGFEVFGFDDGFECGLNPPGMRMSGLYSFDLLGEYFDHLDSVIKKPHGEWAYHWSEIHDVDRKDIHPYVEKIKAERN